MRVRMRIDVSGSRDGRPWPKKGEAFEIPDTEGADLCASGLAEAVAEGDEPAETAVADNQDAEKAVAPSETEEAVAPKAESRPLTTETAAAVTKAPAKKTAAKKAAAASKPSAGDS